MLPDDWYRQLLDTYPKRDGGNGGPARIKRLMAVAVQNLPWEHILEAARKYRIWCGRKGMTGTSYVMMLSTWLGRDEHYIEWYEFDLRDPAKIAEDAERRDLAARAAQLGFKEIAWEHGLPVVKRAIEAEEVKRLAQQAGERGVELPRMRVVK